MKKNLMLVGLSILAVACGGIQEQEERADNTLVLGVEEPDPNISVCGIDTCPGNYHVTRYDCAPGTCGDCGGVRNQTFCSITSPSSGFWACGVDNYLDGHHYVSGYGRTGGCNPVNGSSMMPYTNYGALPAPGSSYQSCSGCAAGDTLTGTTAGNCDPNNPSVSVPNAKSICKKVG